ncbi:hypothetical protein OOK13_45110 [Streptomyces sp. NBC_00378]|nr:hypothetical protein [Streptomyces sp. NBC_00378]MCX5115479.1 hypothetical protein [Streptomyces sp. NBC_00378]
MNRAMMAEVGRYGEGRDLINKAHPGWLAKASEERQAAKSKRKETA